MEGQCLKHSPREMFNLCALRGGVACCGVTHWLWKGVGLVGWSNDCPCWELLKRFYYKKQCFYHLVDYSFQFFCIINFSIVFVCAPFLATCLIFIMLSIFLKVWPFSERCWANLELVLLFLKMIRIKAGVKSLF